MDKKSLLMNNKIVCFICCGKSERILHCNKQLFEHFSNVFENIVYLDLSNVFTSKLYREDNDNIDVEIILSQGFKYFAPESLKECKEFFKSTDMIAISFFSETWNDWYIFYYLKKYNRPLIYILSASILLRLEYSSQKNLIYFILNFRNFVRPFLFRIFRYFTLCGCLAKVDTFYTSKFSDVNAKENALVRFMKNNYNKNTISRYNEVVLINSRFYDSFLANNYKVSNDYIVFIDSILPYDMDQVLRGYQRIDRSFYYINLNRLLDMIGSVLSKEVIICLAPKYNDVNLQDDFGGRMAVKFKTEEFIAKAELVLFHESTAVNSAIIYRKKIIQIEGIHFNDFTKKNLKTFQKIFPFPTIDMFKYDENYVRSILETLKVNQDGYGEYIHKYIIASGQEGVASFVQIADHASNKYGIKKKVIK